MKRTTEVIAKFRPTVESSNRNANLGCQDLKFPTANNIKAVTFTTLQNVIIMTPPDYSKTPNKFVFRMDSPLFGFLQVKIEGNSSQGQHCE